MKKSRGNKETGAGEGEKLGENVISESGGKKSKKRRSTQSDGDEKALLDASGKRETGKRNRVDFFDIGAEDKSNKKKKKPNGDSQAGSTEDAKKNQSVDSSEAEGKTLNSMENAKKKKQRKDPEAAENNSDATTYGKKKQKGTESDQVVTSPSSKNIKRVSLSYQLDEEGVELVRGKRFTKEEDELIKKAVLGYIEAHVLGDQGINMVMNCRSHPQQVKGCWKEITPALPWRPHLGVYHRAHTLFEENSKGLWSKVDFELIKEHQKKHGNHWKTLADAMGKHRRHVRDAWRSIKLASKKKGRWSREEYQNLFDLVNKDLRKKAFQEKRSQHGMLRDNIRWVAISDQLGTRTHNLCCQKWYNQLTSPMVAKGLWANVDDYRLFDELVNLDAACVDDVDWDDLLDNRDGDACRSRWDQMVRHIGLPGTKTFAEQVEIISQRYCPDIAEDRQDFDDRPYED